MSVATVTVPEAADDVDITTSQQEYRAMSSGAVAGLALGVLSALMLGAAGNGLQACFAIAPVPILGMVISYVSLRRIRSMPEDYTGGSLARAGLVLSIFFLVAGIGYGAYLDISERPEGYEPISFAGMKPGELEERAGKIVPDAIRNLDGERVFVKGYMRPPSQRSNLSAFLLVRDNQQCCFGPLADVKYYDQMQVELVPPLKAEYSMGAYRVGGRLKIHPENATPGNPRPVFTLVADYLK